MRKIMVAIALAAAAGSAFAAAPRNPALLGAPPVQREVKRWKMSCDNTRACYAQTMSYDSALGIDRAAGPAGRLLVTLNDREPAESARLDLASIRVDARRPEKPFAWKLDPDGESATLEGTEAVRFLRLIGDAGTLTYRAGGEELTVSLEGLKAIELAMDEVQGRLGGQTALARPGSKAASAVPAALPMPVIPLGPAPRPLAQPAQFAAAVRKANAARLKAADCEDDPSGEADQAYALTSTDALVIIACSMSAHSGNALLLRVPVASPARAQVIGLPTLDGPADLRADPYPTYPFTAWDAETATLSSAAWSCAHACGENFDWTFDGARFVLSRAVSYEPGGGGGLMVAYRTRVVRKSR